LGVGEAGEVMGWSGRQLQAGCGPSASSRDLQLPTRRRHSWRAERHAAPSLSVDGRLGGTSWWHAARLPCDGDRGLPKLPILLYVFMHTELCCT